MSLSSMLGLTIAPPRGRSRESHSSSPFDSSDPSESMSSLASAWKRRARKLSDEFDCISAEQQHQLVVEKKRKAGAATPVRKQASAPAAGAPARASPKRKAAAPAAAPSSVAGARRTSPRNKH